MKKYLILFLLLTAVFAVGKILSINKEEILYTNSLPTAPTPFVEDPVTPYTLSEIEKHNTDKDCWVLIMGSVYDMTRFIDQHPGREAILKGCGKDASALFNAEDSHTPVRRELLKGYKIGILVVEGKK
jgi:cytochrome b involved in lipid metabolism